MAVAHNIGIQTKRKELTKTSMLISKITNPLVSMVYTEIFQRLSVSPASLTVTHVIADLHPANTKHLYNIYITAAKRLWRSADIVQMLYKIIVLCLLGQDCNELISGGFHSLRVHVGRVLSQSGRLGDEYHTRHRALTSPRRYQILQSQKGSICLLVK